LRLGAAFDLAATRTVTLLGGGTIDTNGFTSTLSQVITGAGGFTKAGAGTLTFTGANTYLGGTTIAANIAAQYQAAEPIGQEALIASGLVLFVITLVVNGLARYVVSRGGRRLAAA